MQAQIRAATISDVPTILKLIGELAEFEKLSSEVVATESELARTLFEEGHANVVIAEVFTPEGPQTAGFALYFTSYSTFLAKPGLYLEDLYVLPEYRSKKLGHRLLAHLAGICVSQNYGRLEWSVLDWNTRARDFYIQLGAKPMTDWTVHRLTGAELKSLADSAT